jgi:serine/threonine protein kinase
MARCPSCSADIPAHSRFCLACGAALGSASEVPTVAMAPPIKQPATPISSSSIDEGRFPPGTVLADRYRIVGLVGQGGMGEVYRANDLKLGQPVALKFLPAATATNQQLLARFHAEVRIARQVSHPNVCRVYDIAEVDGATFLSMEYVDGEDLRSLLRRIGRLPGDKAIEISRKLCAGLAAAHDKGVLHRDLKPANIMIDGRGQVLITDFGLAALAGQLDGTHLREGTPAYMAPEQLAGKEVSVRSDVYALGLVLREMFGSERTGSGQTRPGTSILLSSA